MCCTRLAGNTGCKNDAKKSPPAHRLTTLPGYIFTTKVSQAGKNLLNSNISSAYPYNMVNFGPLTAEIGLSVWGTPANFIGFRVLPSLLQRRRQTLRRDTRNGITELSQTAPPIFVWAAITLGIGPHSSVSFFPSTDFSKSLNRFSPNFGT